jgi:3'(2'), 5'-bisphosphate nucleotidase
VRGDAGQRPLELGPAPETRLHVSAVTATEQANVCESVEAAHSNHDESAQVAQLLRIQKAPVRMDSQCKYGWWPFL